MSDMFKLESMRKHRSKVKRLTSRLGELQSQVRILSDDNERKTKELAHIKHNLRVLLGEKG